jgi:thioredoxin
MSDIRHVGNDDWQAIESDPKATLVDFWAEWCGPCRAIAPAFQKLADNYQNQFNFAKVNVDESPELAAKLGIRGIPTLLLIKDGKVVEQLIGARSYDELARALEAHVSAPAPQ